MGQLGARAVALLYPPLCISCAVETDASGGLCADCWVDIQFISGAACDACGHPLRGQDDDQVLRCDGCIQTPQAWDRGRAAVVYNGIGRRIALGLKHGDRLDMAVPISNWMLEAGRDMLDADVIAPVPLHWTRMLKRRYNQAAVLGNQIAQFSGTKTIPDLLIRHKRTIQQKGMSREARFENQSSAIAVLSRHANALENKTVLLIDDVMTTGATLSACAEACFAAGAETVNVLVFARVAREE